MRTAKKVLEFIRLPFGLIRTRSFCENPFEPTGVGLLLPFKSINCKCELDI